MDQWIRFWTALWLGSADLSARTVTVLFCTTPDQLQKKPEPEPDALAENPEPVGEEPPAKGEKEKKPAAPARKKPPATGGSRGLRLTSTAIVVAAVYGTDWTTRIVGGFAAAWTATALVLGYIATLPDEDEDETDGDGQEHAEEPGAGPHPSETLTLHHVAWLLADADTGEGSGVHLATLRGDLNGLPVGGLPAARWEPRDVRALLARHGVRVRPGVRVPPVGGREGVHRDDFPPQLSPDSDPTPGRVVAAGQPGNNNTNNTSGEENREGPTIIPDPKNDNRWLVQHDQ
ncbi:hypothetical protein OG292_19265 [Streptomyces sp. NBC_01511]|uniref:hypothetical protein n=1 Tax=Streptomyces sp. NBC_01511 TaxID=2903889 RepID=UPI0038684167